MDEYGLREMLRDVKARRLTITPLFSLRLAQPRARAGAGAGRQGRPCGRGRAGLAVRRQQEVVAGPAPAGFGVRPTRQAGMDSRSVRRRWRAATISCRRASAAETCTASWLSWTASLPGRVNTSNRKRLGRARR